MAPSLAVGDSRTVSSTPAIRSVRADDTEAMRSIYAPFVESSGVSFEEAVPDETTFRARVESGARTHPWLVAELDGRLAGYAYASVHRARAAYRWSAEVSVYVAEGFRRAGLGRALYLELFERLRALGYLNAFAGITLPNPASVRLHESLGFEPVGVFRRIGFKHGRWHDVGWYALRLGEDDHPSEPRSPALD